MEKKILATVNGKEITNLDVEQLINTLPPQQAMYYTTDEAKKQIAKELVDQELFYLEAIDTEIEKTEIFKEELNKLKEGLLKQLAVNKSLESVKVTEEDVLSHYNSNTHKYKKPAMANAKHILVKTKEHAQELLEKIKSNIVSFEDCAKEHSTCPSKEAGGDLGEFSRGQMVPEFEEVAFTIAEGEVSEPVETQFGYHLIKLVSLTDEMNTPFEEVKHSIEEEVKHQKMQTAFEDKIAELNEKYADKFEIL